MKKISVAAVLLGLLAVVPVHGSAAPTDTNPQVSAKEANAINSIVEEIAAAAQAGDEQLVAKLLASAVKNNPAIADKIVAAFVDNQSSQSANNKSANAINVSAVINSVVSSLQNQKGSEALVASVLSSFNPAAGGNQQGGNNNNNNNNNNNPNNNPKLPPALPKAGQVSGTEGSNNTPKENPNQTSPN